MENNMLAMDESENFVAELQGGSVSNYCSFTPQTREEKTFLFNATNNPKYRMSDFINQEITFRYVYAETVECVNQETGEIRKCPRIILINENGDSWTAVSRGIFSAVAKIIVSFGQPETWDGPMTVRVKQVTRGERKMLTLEVVG